MIYIPLMAFMAAVGWMVWRGFEAKKEYLHAKQLEERLQKREEEFRKNIDFPGQQGGPDLGKALGGSKQGERYETRLRTVG